VTFDGGKSYGRLSASLVTSARLSLLQLEPPIHSGHSRRVTMNSHQAAVLEGSSMTMVAHGLPMVPATTHPVAFPSTTNREYVVSTTTNIVDTVSKIAKEAGEMFKDVPYIKAFAGIIIRVIEIREVRELAGERDCLTLTWPRRKSKWRRIDHRNSSIRYCAGRRLSWMGCSASQSRRTWNS
jgi:hypothetical protein